MDNLRDAGFGSFKISLVATRHNVDQLDGFKAIADEYGAQLRVTRLRPSGRGELEITDVNNEYIQRGELGFDRLSGYWTDAGTHESLRHANELVLGK